MRGKDEQQAVHVTVIGFLVLIVFWFILYFVGLPSDVNSGVLRDASRTIFFIVTFIGTLMWLFAAGFAVFTFLIGGLEKERSRQEPYW